ncbi:MAG: hypothetical protein HGA27_00465 [Peptococcaceae bacterium]|nr:hypothetical protein [Peptococcaceae bacterium]
MTGQSVKCKSSFSLAWTAMLSKHKALKKTIKNAVASLKKMVVAIMTNFS